MNRRQFLATTATTVATVQATRGLAAPAAGYQVLAADKGQVALIGIDGKPTWKRPLRAEVHDINLLPDGGVLLPVARDRVAEWAVLLSYHFALNPTVVGCRLHPHTKIFAARVRA